MERLLVFGCQAFYTSGDKPGETYLNAPWRDVDNRERDFLLGAFSETGTPECLSWTNLRLSWNIAPTQCIGHRGSTCGVRSAFQVSSGFLCLSTAVLISGDEALYEDEAVSNLHPVEALLMTLQARKYELFLETGATIWH